MSAEYLNYLHNTALESGKQVTLGTVEEMEVQFLDLGVEYKKETKAKEKKADNKELTSVQEAYKLTFGEEKYDKTPKKFTNDIEWMKGKLEGANK